MSEQNSNRRSTPRVAVNLLVRLQFEAEQDFIHRYATNISSGGIFLHSRKPYPKGTILKFEIQLKDGETVLRGRGVVAWSREPSRPDEKPKAPGMGIKFLELDSKSKAVVKKILSLKTESQVVAESKSPSPKTSNKPAQTNAKKDSSPTPPAVEDEEVSVPVDIDLDMADGLDDSLSSTSRETGEPQASETILAEAKTADSEISVEVDLEDVVPPVVDVPPPVAAGKNTAETGFDVDLDFENMQPAKEPSKPAQALDVDISLDDFASPSPSEEKAQASTVPIAPTGGASSRMIGIDLGTTNSCVSVVIEGKPRVISSQKGYNTTPSIVAYTNDGRLLVGHSAKAQMELNPENTVYGSKRLIGRAYDSPAVQQMKDRFHYQIIRAPNAQTGVRILSRDFSLQQIAALILGEMRSVARNFLGEEASRAVITVPAYFNENQRSAVREAGILAGMQVERIVNEPTAAALAFGYERGLDQRILVYDLGGGTFDVTVIELCGNVYEVLATGGDTFLGGVDFDNQIVDHLWYTFVQSLPEAPKLDRPAMQRLRDAAEQAKCILSQKEETTVRLLYFATVAGQPINLEVSLTRAILNSLLEPLVDRTIQVTREVLQRANLQPQQIDDVLLVGGQTRMPLVWEKIKQVFGREPHKGVHPDEAVAMGAALLGDSIGKIDSVVLIDVLPVSIGIGIPGGRFLKIIEAGTSLPASKAYQIRTFKENQRELELTLFQGESERVVDCEYLETVAFSGFPVAPKGDVQIEINFSLNSECLLKVTGRQVGSSSELRLKTSSKESGEVLRNKLNISPEESATVSYGVSVPLTPRKVRSDPGKGPTSPEKPGWFKKKK